MSNSSEIRISLFDLIMSLSEAVDYISPKIANHHKEVAYIALNIAKEYGFSLKEQQEIFIAASLHDIGAISYTLKERLDTLHFDIKNPHKHAELGYNLLKTCELFSNLADLVRFHHVPWNEGGGIEFAGFVVPIASHIIHLSDRVTVLKRKNVFVLHQIERICKLIKKHAGKTFNPELVEIFLDFAQKEYFWLDIVSSKLETILAQNTELGSVMLNMDKLSRLAKFFSYIIDFRSRFTATHSSGVAAVSKELAKTVGFSDIECQMMQVAGYLHDLGKLAVPTEVLEKPDKLTRKEYELIRSHTYFTYSLLQRIRDFSTINKWASFHHERLDGKGYPFHHRADKLPLGSRIMAVADVYTALTEDRPYRKGLEPQEALRIIYQMAENSAFDLEIVATLSKHKDDIEDARREAQSSAVDDYRRLYLSDNRFAVLESA